MKKRDVDEVVSLKALDDASSKNHSEDISKPKECLVNGNTSMTEVNGFDLSFDGVKKDAEDVKDHVEEVLLNGSAGIEEVSPVNERIEETEINKPLSNKAEGEYAIKGENIHLKENGTAKEVETIGDGAVRREKSAELEQASKVGLKDASKDASNDASKEPSNLEEAHDAFDNQMESTSWHWSYYLITAALIALTAISVHLFREKSRA